MVCASSVPHVSTSGAIFECTTSPPTCTGSHTHVHACLRTAEEVEAIVAHTNNVHTYTCAHAPPHTLSAQCGMHPPRTPHTQHAHTTLRCMVHKPELSAVVVGAGGTAALVGCEILHVTRGCGLEVAGAGSVACAVDCDVAGVGVHGVSVEDHALVRLEDVCVRWGRGWGGGPMLATWWAWGCTARGWKAVRLCVWLGSQ